MSLDVGSIKGKKPLVDIINKYKIPLVAISLIHYIGTKKYELFSWYNNPSKSDSTIANNISALIRHFSAHRSGCLFDLMMVQSAVWLNFWRTPKIAPSRQLESRDAPTFSQL